MKFRRREDKPSLLGLDLLRLPAIWDMISDGQAIRATCFVLFMDSGSIIPGRV